MAQRLYGGRGRGGPGDNEEIKNWKRGKGNWIEINGEGR